MENKITTASLFTGGFGSFKYMLDHLNINHTVEFGCEILKPQRECYELNYGKPKEWFTDITTADFSRYWGKIDILQASPVCKSYSMVGKREGLNSDDGLLMNETIKAIATIQPKVFIVENSASLTSVNSGRDWELIMKQFYKLKGYTITHGKMNERHYGVPQNRNRLFIIGFRAKTHAFAFPPRVELKLRTRDLLEYDVDKKYDISEAMLKGFEAHAKRHKSFGMKVMSVDGVCKAITTKCGNRATDPFIDRNELIRLGNIATSGHDSIWGRVYSIDGIECNQNANGAKTRRIARLTPREQARIMGDIEDKFKFGNFSDTKLSQFIGNAIGLGTMEHLLQTILREYKTKKFNNPIKQSLDEIAIKEQKGLF